jgi:hypothetical protein
MENNNPAVYAISTRGPNLSTEDVTKHLVEALGYELDQNNTLVWRGTGLTPAVKAELTRCSFQPFRSATRYDGIRINVSDHGSGREDQFAREILESAGNSGRGPIEFYHSDSVTELEDRVI